MKLNHTSNNNYTATVLPLADKHPEEKNISKLKEHNKKEKKSKETWPLFSLLFLPFAYLFVEMSTRYFLFGIDLSAETIHIILSCLIVSGLIMFTISFMNAKRQRIIAGILLFIFEFYCCGHLVYTNTFHSFFCWNTIGIAKDVTEFWRETITSIIKSGLPILIIMIPFILFIVFAKRYYLESKIKYQKVVYIAISVIAAISLYTMTVTNKENIKLIKYINNNVSATYKCYGITTSTIADIYHCVFGYQEETIINPYVDDTTRDMIDVTMNEERVIFKNALPIDFDKLIANSPNTTIADMSKYFASVPASNKNDYTGLFEGKNLVFLTLEGFSYKAISPELTPTLYKMMTQGFYFTNFYDSLWGGSTATGEYANMTGNFYTTANCLPKSADTLQYSAMGNLFKNAGYKTLAYHNNTYTYYSRDLSHPNFGYTYKGIGNGLELDYYWPRSDYEMAVATIDEYIDSDVPFHAYYMTISSHAYYTFVGNNMSERHYDEVADLPNSSNIKAYIACNLEVENMLTYMVQRFEEAGILENTVFAMCPDHYPYALDDKELSELYGLPESNIRENLDLYRNSFILWSSSLEKPVIIDTPCSSYDIVPTLANLFGIEFDSRFITGTDILSDNENIAIINTPSTGYNWISPEGTYYSATKEFIKNTSCTLTDEELASYIKKTSNKVDAMRKYSIGILDNDYYRYVFNKDGTPKYPLSDE